MEDRHAIIPALQVAGADGATVAFASVLDGHMGSQVPLHGVHSFSNLAEYCFPVPAACLSTDALINTSSVVSLTFC